MATILRFNTLKEQIENLQNYGKYEDIIFSNREDKTISYTKDSLEGKEFYCEDIDGNQLYTIENPWYMNELNVVSNNVKSISLYDVDTNERIRTVKTFDVNGEEPLYRVGLISDVHYNDYDTDEDPDTYNDDSSEYSEDFKNAMKFFNEQNIDFISCSGDITTDNENHLKNFKLSYNKYGQELPLYTCVGNHDTIIKLTQKDKWMEIDHLNDKYGIVRFNDTDGTSFYFVKEIDETHKDIYIYLNLEYGWSSQNHRNHEARQLKWEDNELLTKENIEGNVDSNDYHLYGPDTLLELERILEEFKNDRCFIFTHIMFKDMAGTYHSNDLYNYYNTHSDVMRGDQGNFCRQLLAKYSNNYWFSGHSHYKWMWHKYDKDINVKAAENGSYTIHIPSLARPLNVSTGYSVAGKDSEAGIMDVYRDYVIINGYVLKEEKVQDINDYNSMIEQYNGQLNYMNASYLYPENAEYAEITSLDNNYISITLKENPTNIWYRFNAQEMPTADAYKTLLPVIRFEDVLITNGAGENITEEVMNEHKIGFMDIFDGNYNYYLLSNHYYTLNSMGLKFKLSSASSYVGQNITVKFKAKYALIKISYQNKKYELATYRL